MKPILYSTITEGTVPTHYGVGVLSDCLSCRVKEQLNNEYELEMEFAANGAHASEIIPTAFLKAKPNYTDDPQLFQIYKVGKNINGRFTVNARHSSYLLSDKVITSGTAASCAAACLLLTGQAGNFTITTDKSVNAAFNISEPSSVKSWFGGKQGSILDVYGPGEWKYDNFSAEFKAARGQNRGVTIRYGKNLTQLSQEIDMTNLVSAIIPYYKAQDGTITSGAAVSTGLTGITRELAVDFSPSVDPESATPIATQLAALASDYISKNNFLTFKNSIKLNFVQLKELSERVDLGDTVSIYFEPLNIAVTAKCIETVWDVIEERYISTSFGDASANIADTIVAAQKAIDEKPSTTVMQQAIDQATELITGNLGGYVVFHDGNGDGYPDEILIMDTADIATATKVWRWNSGGLGFSPNGYSGPYNAVAIDMEGRIVADAITTGTLNADLIKAGIISDVAGNSTIDMADGTAIMKNFKAKNSFQFVDENGVVRGSFWYDSANGCNLEIRDQSGNVVTWLTSDNLGGSLYLTNHNQKSSVEATVDGNNAGVVYVCNSSGTDKIDLYGYSGHIWCVRVDQGSSRKIKKNIKPIEDAQEILKLQAVSFDYIEEEMGTDNRGFIAEDVAEILPNLVTPESDDKPASLDYISMIPYLQAVIKEQEKRITELEKKLNEITGG